MLDERKVEVKQKEMKNKNQEGRDRTHEEVNSLFAKCQRAPVARGTLARNFLWGDYWV